MNAKLIVPTLLISGVMSPTLSFGQNGPTQAEINAALGGAGNIVSTSTATGAQVAGALANAPGAVSALGAGGSSLGGVAGSASNFFGGMLGGGGAAAGGSAAAAGGSAAAGVGGAAGVGAMVQDIGNILLQGLQIWQLFSQTGILNQQQESLNEIKQLSAQDLASTQEMMANIGSTANFNAAAQSALQAGGSSLGGGAGPASNFFSMPTASETLLGVDTSGQAGAGGGNALAALLDSERSPLSKIGDFIGGKASSLYDIFSDANEIAGMAGGFKDNPVETSMEILRLLFADDRTQQLKGLTDDQMSNYGFATTIGALSNDLDVNLLKSSQNASDRYQARMQRIGTIQQYLNTATDQSSVLVLQTQLQKEIAGIQADNLAANEASNAAAAARAVNESAFVKMRVLENQSTMRMSR